jgi:FtsH-binding integral membrane protein
MDDPFRPRKVFDNDSDEEETGDVRGQQLLSPHARRHLQRVYGRLGLTVASASLAGWLVHQGVLPNSWGILPMLGGFLLLLALRFSAPDFRFQGQLQGGRSRWAGWPTVRPWLLYGFGFMQGWGLTPLTSVLLDVDPALLYQSVALSLLVFASFSVTAVVTQRRTFLAYGGVLVTGLFLLGAMALLDALFPTRLGFDVLVYGGLLLFSFLVAYHTQAIVEHVESQRFYRSAAADGRQVEVADDVAHATMLFDDLVNVFIRVAIIMLQQEQNRHRSSSSDRRRRRGQ